MGLTPSAKDSACSHSAISALQLQKQETNPVRLKGQCSDAGLFGWQQDLLKLVQKGAGDYTVVLVGMGKDLCPSGLLALKP